MNLLNPIYVLGSRDGFFEAIRNLIRSAPIDWLGVINIKDNADIIKAWEEGKQRKLTPPELVIATCITEISGRLGQGAIILGDTDDTVEMPLKELDGAEFIILTGLDKTASHATNHILLHDPSYELIEENMMSQGGFSIFRRRHRTCLDSLQRDTAVHFFTVLRDDTLFIETHLEILQQLSFLWHWHLVDSRQEYSAPSDSLNKYLRQISIYRKPEGQSWKDDLEMANEPLRHIFEDVVLWQLVLTERWTVAQLEVGRSLFLNAPEKAAAWFRSEAKQQSSVAAWSFRPGMKWLSSNPLVLGERQRDDTWLNVAGRHDFDAQETVAAGLVPKNLLADSLDKKTPPKIRIVVDGVFFQLNNTGIGRLWQETLRQWGASKVGENVWLLDRDGTAPEISGIQRQRIHRYQPKQPGTDAFLLQEICDDLRADVFISTYYTAPLTIPTVALIYDMIPELLRVQNTSWKWREKRLSTRQAQRVVCISASTAHDLQRIHPEIDSAKISVVPLAAPPEYAPQTEAAVNAFRQRFGLEKRYLLVVGERIGLYLGNQAYKNIGLVFKAWSLLTSEEKQSLDILCVGGKPKLEEELSILAPDARVHLLRLSDEDLQCAYSGAVTLVYPSLYEGFGLPVVEAMACGCPVITCRRASLPEVAGDAAIYIDPWNARELTEAIQQLLINPLLHEEKCRIGLLQAAQFSMRRFAEGLIRVLNVIANQDAVVQDEMLLLLRKSSQHLEASYTDLLVKNIDLKVGADKVKANLKVAQSALREAKEKLRDTKEQLKKAKWKQKPVPWWRKIIGKH